MDPSESLRKMESAEARVKQHEIVRLGDGAAAGTTGEAQPNNPDLQMKGAVMLFGEDLQAADAAVKLITADAANEFAHALTDCMIDTHRSLDDKVRAVGQDFGRQLCNVLTVRPKDALRLHSEFVSDTRSVLTTAVRRLAEHESQLLKHIREHSGKHLHELIVALMAKYKQQGKDKASSGHLMGELRQENRALHKELTKMKEYVSAGDRAYDDARKARAEKMKAIRAINSEREKTAALSKAHKEKEEKLRHAAETVENLQNTMHELQGQVAQLEHEREQMKNAVAQLKTCAEEQDMKSLKTGQLVGKIAAKLHAKILTQAQQTVAVQKVSADVNSHMANLKLNLSSLSASTMAVISVQKWKRKMMAKRNLDVRPSSAHHNLGSDYPPGVSRTTTAVELRAMVEAGAITEEQRREVLATHRKIENAESFKYMAGISQSTTASELQAMVEAGVLSEAQMREALATQHIVENGNTLDYPSGVSRSTTVSEMQAMVEAGTLTEAQMREALATQHILEHGQDLDYPVGVSQSTTASEMQAMVKKGKLTEDKLSEALATQYIVEHGHNFDYPLGVSRSTTVSEMQAMVKAGTIREEQMREALAMQHIAGQAQSFVYPPGVSQSTSVSEMQAMVEAGTLTESQMREVLAVQHILEHGHNIDYPFGVSRSTTVSEMQAMVKAGTISEEQMCEALAMQHIAGQTQSFEYPPGVSQSTTESKMQAMVEAGTLTKEQMCEVLATQHISEHMQALAHPLGVSKSSTATTNAMVQGGTFSDDELRSALLTKLAMQHIAGQAQSFVYPPGVSQSTSVSEMQAMVEAGTLTISQMREVLAVQHVLEHGHKIDYPLGVSRSTTVSEMQAMVKAGTISEEQMCEALAMQHVAGQAQSFEYPPGVSQSTTESKMQAMVEAGTLTKEQMREAQALQWRQAQEQPQIDFMHEYPPGVQPFSTHSEMQNMVEAGMLTDENMVTALEHIKASRLDWLTSGISSGIITRIEADDLFRNWEGPRGIAARRHINSRSATGGSDQMQAKTHKARRQQGKESKGVNAVDELLRKAMKKQGYSSREQPPAGRWIAGFWIPEPWQYSAVSFANAESNAVAAVSTKLRYTNGQTSFSDRHGTSRSDGAIGGASMRCKIKGGTTRREVSVQQLEPRTDFMSRVPKPPPAETRQTYQERTGTPRLPLLARTQLVNEEIAQHGPPATMLAGQMGVQVTRSGTGPPPTPPGQGPWIDHINALNRRPRRDAGNVDV